MSSPFLLLYPHFGWRPAAAAPSQRRVRRGAESYPRPRAKIRPADRSPRLTAGSADPSRGVGPVAGGPDRPLAACPVISYHHKTAGGDNASPLLPRARSILVDKLTGFRFIFFFALSAVMRYPALYASSIGHRPIRTCLSFLCNV